MDIDPIIPMVELLCKYYNFNIYYMGEGKKFRKFYIAKRYPPARQDKKIFLAIPSDIGKHYIFSFLMRLEQRLMNFEEVKKQ